MKEQQDVNFKWEDKLASNAKFSLVASLIALSLVLLINY